MAHLAPIRVPTLKAKERVEPVVHALGSELLRVFGAGKLREVAVPIAIGPPVHASPLVPVSGALAGASESRPRPLNSASGAEAPFQGAPDLPSGRGGAKRLIAGGSGTLLLLITATVYLYGVQQRVGPVESPPASPVEDERPETIVRPDAEPLQPAHDPSTQNAPTPSIEPVELARLINEELSAAGIDTVDVLVDRAYVATLRGTVASRDQRDAIVHFVESISEIAGVRDQLQLRRIAPPRTEVSRVRPAAPPEPVGRAEAPIENRTFEPDRLESEINRALIQEGFDGVRSEVDERGQITLKGTVKGSGQKARVFALARSVGKTGSVRDLVFVVED
jgi:osmotically-inducible protein OsmY